MKVLAPEWSETFRSSINETHRSNVQSTWKKAPIPFLVYDTFRPTYIVPLVVPLWLTYDSSLQNILLYWYLHVNHLVLSCPLDIYPTITNTKGLKYITKDKTTGLFHHMTSTCLLELDTITFSHQDLKIPIPYVSTTTRSESTYK